VNKHSVPIIQLMSTRLKYGQLNAPPVLCPWKGFQCPLESNLNMPYKWAYTMISMALWCLYLGGITLYINGENHMIRNFIIYVLWPVLFKWLYEGYGGQDISHVWGKVGIRRVHNFGRNVRLKEPHGEARRWRNMMRIHTELSDLNMGSPWGRAGCECGNKYVDSVKAAKFFNQSNT
jgi:hypothetical protein